MATTSAKRIAAVFTFLGMRGRRLSAYIDRDADKRYQKFSYVDKKARENGVFYEDVAKYFYDAIYKFLRETKDISQINTTFELNIKKITFGNKQLYLDNGRPLKLSEALGGLMQVNEDSHGRSIYPTDEQKGAWRFLLEEASVSHFNLIFDVVIDSCIDEAIEALELRNEYFEVQSNNYNETQINELIGDHGEYILLRADLKNGRLECHKNIGPENDDWFENLGIMAVPVKFCHIKEKGKSRGVFWTDLFFSDDKTLNYVRHSVGRISNMRNSIKNVVSGYDVTDKKDTRFFGIFGSPNNNGGCGGIMFSYQLQGGEMEAYKFWIMRCNDQLIPNFIRGNTIIDSIDDFVKYKRSLDHADNEIEHNLRNKMNKFIYFTIEKFLSEGGDLRAIRYLFPACKRVELHDESGDYKIEYRLDNESDLMDVSFRNGLNYELLQIPFLVHKA